MTDPMTAGEAASRRADIARDVVNRQMGIPTFDARYTAWHGFIATALARAAAEERERCIHTFIDEYTDALRNGLDLAAAYRCGLAALRAAAPAKETRAMREGPEEMGIEEA